MTQELGTLPIKLFGSDEMKQRILPACATGEAIPAFGLSEPGAGSDPPAWSPAPASTATNGSSTAPRTGSPTPASRPSTSSSPSPPASPSAKSPPFLVEADRPGVSVGKLEHKMGMRSSPTGQPIFDDVRVPASNVIGDVGKGMRVALGTLQVSRLGAAAQAVGPRPRPPPTTPSPT